MECNVCGKLKSDDDLNIDDKGQDEVAMEDWTVTLMLL
jgi:hypothetical protein